MTDRIRSGNWDVVIIGGGPAGLGAAITLKKAGITNIIVLERENEAGGIPRHCGHPPFGIREYGRILTGPAYARRITGTAKQLGIDIALKTSVTSLGADGKLTILQPKGELELQAKRVLIATGTRETPRSARFVSGNRPLGIYNTGALQAMVYLKNKIPFRRPVIVGTEIVSFSALFTCKRAGIQPAAILEANKRPSVSWPIHYSAGIFGVTLYRQTELVEILGKQRVTGVRVSDGNNHERVIECDGVLFTGRFVPEAGLVQMSHLESDPATGAPTLDRYGRCSDKSYYAAGNIIKKPVKVAGKCWQNGKTAGQWIAKDLAGQLF
jgi:thioredoxin reductase